MYFYLAMVGFEPTPTSTAAPSNIYDVTSEKSAHLWDDVRFVGPFVGSAHLWESA